MSKIDEYNSVKSLNTHDIIALNHAKQLKADGTTDPANDKGRLMFCDCGIWDTDMKVFIHACYGYYGSSDCYAVRSENMKKYMIRAMNCLSENIINKAQLLMREDIEKARKAAEAEALEVLGKIEAEANG